MVIKSSTVLLCAVQPFFKEGDLAGTWKTVWDDDEDHVFNGGMKVGVCKVHLNCVVVAIGDEDE